MGANSSSLSELANNEHLLKLTGKEAISIDNTNYWQQLVTYAFVPPISATDAKLLEEQAAPLLKQFAANNLTTGNLRALIAVFVAKATTAMELVNGGAGDAAAAAAGASADANKQETIRICVMQAYNALFICRAVLKHLLEFFNEESLLHHVEFNSQSSAASTTTASTGQTKTDLEADEEDLSSSSTTSSTSSTNEQSGLTNIEQFISTVVQLLVSLKVTDTTYALVYECTCTLIVLMSSPMYTHEPADSQSLYHILYTGRQSMQAYKVTRVLLQHFAERPAAPEQLVVNAGQSYNSLYGAAASLATGLWSVVTLGYAGRAQASEREELRRSLLARQCCLLCLCLVNHCANSRSLRNAYREAIFGCADVNDTDANAGAVTFRCDLQQLLQAVSSQLPADESLLLLYLLLHSSGAARLRRHLSSEQLSSEQQLSQLLLPILHTLHSQPQNSSHRMYMALIVLLMLTECTQLCNRLFRIAVQAGSVAWFTERQLGSISIGSLLVIVLARTVQLNCAKLKDKYLHTNCLAALANLSTHFYNLHSYASQKLFATFGQFVKKRAKLVEQLQQLEAGSEALPEAEADLASIEELMRHLLEIINNAFTNSLLDNPHLIYTQLHQRFVYKSVNTHPAFQDIVQNLELVIHHFASALAAEEATGGGQLSERRVMQIIHEQSRGFRRDKLKKFAEPKYKYVEEESPDEFFIPYIWALVYKFSNLYFNASRVVLLKPMGNEGSQA